MVQMYSDPKRESDPHALPDVEVFYISETDYLAPELQSDESGPYSGKGYYYWYVFPGCLPDTDPVGPFKTEAEAVADMRDNADIEEGV